MTLSFSLDRHFKRMLFEVEVYIFVQVFDYLFLFNKALFGSVSHLISLNLLDT